MLLLALLSIAVFLCVGLIVVAIIPTESHRLVRQRISEVAVTRPTSIWHQVLNKVISVNRFLPFADWYSMRLVKIIEMAGLRLQPFQFLAVQEVVAVIAVGLGVAWYLSRPAQHFNSGTLMIVIFVGFLAPLLWLRQQIQLRRMQVSQDLPEVVDLLALCVGAGTDLMGALTKVVKEFRPCPLRDELAVVLQEVRVGRRRREALREMAIRLNTPETTAFVRTLIQVDRMGTGLAQAMPILSEDMRIQRYNWAERFAQKAPMKMLIPLVLSLGASMVIVAGPILVKFFRGGLMDPAKTMMTRQ